MSDLFKNHAFDSEILDHKDLPLCKTKEFAFYRCVTVSDWVYEKTVSELHEGNLRDNTNENNRYSKLFPNEKISYWADSKEVALAEIKKHNGNKNYLTFSAYDDVSSTFPILGIDDELVIIDGRKIGFSDILQKIDDNEKLSKEECDLIKKIKKQNPDCLAYKSHANPKGTNFLFFEKGFKKLALREVRLYLGERKAKNHNVIKCAYSCDYSPCIKNYGCYFKPIAKKAMDSEYESSNEYKNRLKRLNKQRKLIENAHNTI
ncbi:MAG: hypothetical protein R3Y12_01815 [Clostridia bacterium]